MMLLRAVLKALVLPPFNQLIGITIGLLIYKRYPKLGKILIIYSLVSMYLLSTSYISGKLYGGLEKISHLPTQELQTLSERADAIVILTAWQNEHTPEFGHPVSGLNGLSRARYGAHIHNISSLPILVSGGNVFGDSAINLAETMAFDLETAFKVKAKWVENRSRTTAENAYYSKEMLANEGINRIILVSNAYHLKRAQQLFENQGFEVIPAPTYFVSKQETSFRSFIPNAYSLNDSAIAIHEWLGYYYYKITL